MNTSKAERYIGRQLEDPGEIKRVSFDEMIEEIARYIQVCPKMIARLVQAKTIGKSKWEKEGTWELELMKNGDVVIGKILYKVSRRAKNRFVISPMEAKQWVKGSEPTEWKVIRKAVLEVLAYKETTEPARETTIFGQVMKRRCNW